MPTRQEEFEKFEELLGQLELMGLAINPASLVPTVDTFDQYLWSILPMLDKDGGALGFTETKRRLPREMRAKTIGTKP